MQKSLLTLPGGTEQSNQTLAFLADCSQEQAQEVIVKMSPQARRDLAVQILAKVNACAALLVQNSEAYWQEAQAQELK